jgi:hypothetical protein
MAEGKPRRFALVVVISAPGVGGLDKHAGDKRRTVEVEKVITEGFENRVGRIRGRRVGTIESVAISIDTSMYCYKDKKWSTSRDG